MHMVCPVCIYTKAYKALVWIICIPDTGINYDHVVFEGRASFGGYDKFGGQGVDDHGHRTHCAGLAAGRLTGVA